MLKIPINVFIILLLIVSNSGSQILESNHRDMFPKGIMVDYGAGRFAVQDDFFSREKYSGTLPYFKIGWSRFHGNRAFQLNLKYGSSAEIKNNQLTANVVLFALEWNSTKNSCCSNGS